MSEAAINHRGTEIRQELTLLSGWKLTEHFRGTSILDCSTLPKVCFKGVYKVKSNSLG